MSYKQEFGEWQEVAIDPDRKTYTLDGVKCGSSYQLFLTAVNLVGNGKPSSVVTATTKGGGMQTTHINDTSTSISELLYEKQWKLYCNELLYCHLCKGWKLDLLFSMQALISRPSEWRILCHLGMFLMV